MNTSAATLNQSTANSKKQQKETAKKGNRGQPCQFQAA